MKRLLYIMLLSVCLFSCNKDLELLYFNLSPTDVTMYSTEQKQLIASASFSGKDSVDFIWSSSNPEVATINKYGVITAIEPGTTVISVSCNNVTKKCNVTVNQETYISLKTINKDYNSISSWKNGEISNLTSTSFNAKPTDISVNKTDVYTSGNVIALAQEDLKQHAAFWKNGTILILTDNNTSSEANSICIYNEKVYTGGALISDAGKKTPAYWINDELHSLPTYNGTITDLKVKDNEIIAGGYIITDNSTQAAIWINDEIQLYPGNDAIIKSIAINNNDIFAVGTTKIGNTTTSTLWKNHELYILNQESSEANDIFIHNSSIYISGNIFTEPYNTPCYWLDNKLYQLPTDIYTNTYTKGISVTGKDVFIIGYDKYLNISTADNSYSPNLWINGEMVLLQNNANIDMIPVSIFTR